MTATLSFLFFLLISMAPNWDWQSMCLTLAVLLISLEQQARQRRDYNHKMFETTWQDRQIRVRGESTNLAPDSQVFGRHSLNRRATANHWVCDPKELFKCPVQPCRDGIFLCLINNQSRDNRIRLLGARSMATRNFAHNTRLFGYFWPAAKGNDIGANNLAV